jgi:hypothetical protein
MKDQFAVLKNHLIVTALHETGMKAKEGGICMQRHKNTKKT